LVEIRGVEPLTFSMPFGKDKKARDGARRREVDFTAFRAFGSMVSRSLKTCVL